MKTYYDLRAKDYDDSTYRRADLTDLAALCQTLRALESGRTLDIACGTGWLSQYLRGDLVGLDQSRRMLACFQRRHPGAETVHADVPPLPAFDGGSFDRCLSAHFLGHLQLAERSLLLSQAKRLAPELVIVEQQRPAGYPVEGWEERPLGDAFHRVYKHYWTGAQLAAEIGGSVLLENDSYIAARWQHTPAPQHEG